MALNEYISCYYVIKFSKFNGSSVYDVCCARIIHSFSHVIDIRTEKRYCLSINYETYLDKNCYIRMHCAWQFSKSSYFLHNGLVVYNNNPNNRKPFATEKFHSHDHNWKFSHTIHAFVHVWVYTTCAVVCKITSRTTEKAPVHTPVW